MYQLCKLSFVFANKAVELLNLIRKVLPICTYESFNKLSSIRYSFFTTVFDMFCIRDNACVNHVGLFSPKYDLKQMSNATFSLFLAKS